MHQRTTKNQTGLNKGKKMGLQHFKKRKKEKNLKNSQI